MKSMISTASLQPANFSREPTLNVPPNDFHVAKSTSASMSSASPATGLKSPPGCWNGIGTASKSPVKPVDSEQTKRSAKQSAKQSECSRTTVMLRNLPSYFSRDMVIELLEALDYANKYDFVHMPTDLIRISCLGFAFVNMRTHEDAVQFIKDANGFKDWPRPSNKVMDASWSNP